MQFDMSAPKIFPTSSHQDAKRKQTIEKLGDWFPGSWNSSTFVHFSCCQVVRHSCCVQLSLGDGNSPALELHFKEQPSTLKLGGLGHSKENSHTGRAVGASTTIPHLITPALRRGTSKDWELISSSAQHTMPTAHQGCPTSRHSPPRALSGSGSAFSQELLYLTCQQSRPASEEFQDYGNWCQMQ